MKELLKKVDTAIDKAFELTYLPQLAESGAEKVGSGFDALFGTNIAPTVGRIGRDVPRMVAEGVATLPLGPAAPISWFNKLRKVGQAAGYGFAFARGTADTDSYAGGAIDAATLGLGNKLLLPAKYGGVDVGERAAEAVRRRMGYDASDISMQGARDLLTPDLRKAGTSALDLMTPGQRIAGHFANYGSQAGTAVALNEASRQGMLSVGPNAVGLDDPQRNPLTAENIAGNVVGALPFAFQAAVASKANTNPRQVAQLKNWIDARKDAERTQFGYDWEGPVTAEQYHDTFGTLEGAPAFRDNQLVPTEEYWTPEIVVDRKVPGATDLDQLSGALRTQLNTMRDQRERGDSLGYNQTAEEVTKILEGLPGAGADPRMVAQMVKEFDVKVRQMVPENPGDLKVFLRELNAFGRMVNENTWENFTETQKTKAAEGRTWHPEARDPMVVEDLRKRGLVPEITEEWLAKEAGVELAKSGEPNFSYQVALQKAWNRVLKDVPEALKKRQEMPQTTPTPESPGVLKAQNENAKFAVALDKLQSILPPDVTRELIDRTVKIFGGQAFISKRGKTAGRLVDQVSSWRKAVMQAVESFDPATETVLLRKQGKYVRAHISEMYFRDENGYIWSPVTTAVPIGEGGKSTTGKGGKTVPETNIEDLPQQGNIADEVLDEDLFKTALAEEGIGGSLRAKETAGLGEGKAGEERVIDPKVVGTPDADVLDAEKTAKTLKLITDKKAAIERTLSTLDDENLYRLSRQIFENPQTGRDQSAYFRRNGGLRQAVLAALENQATFSDQAVRDIGTEGKKFLQAVESMGIKLRRKSEKSQLQNALQDFFKQSVKVEGGKSGVAWLDRLGLVLERMADEKTVDLLRPKKAESGSAAVPESTDLFANTQPPGTFATDVISTLRTRFHEVLGDQGYAGTLRDMMTEMAVAIAQQYGDVPMDFFRLSSPDSWGRATVGGDGRGKVGLEIDKVVIPEDGTRWAHRVLDTLAHELAHIDEFILKGLLDAPDAFSEQRRRQLENVHSLAGMLDVEQRSAMLDTLWDALIPKEYQRHAMEADGKYRYGSSDPTEFVAEVNALITRSLLRGEKGGMKTALEVLDYGPTEIREFARGTYRSLYDVLSPMTDTIEDTFYRKHAGQPPLAEAEGRNRRVTARAFHAIVNAAREGSALRDSDKVLAQARAYTASLTPPSATALPIVTPAMWFHSAKEIGKYHPDAGIAKNMPAAVDAIRQAQDVLGYEYTKPGVWARWFYPYANLMQSMERAGFPLARTLMNLSLDLGPGINRTRTQMLQPFLRQGADGQFHWNEEQPLVRWVSEKKTGPWRDALREVSAWQQENGAKSLFIQGPDGRVTVNESLPGAQEKWDSVRSRLSPEEQSVVMAGRVAMDQVSQLGAQRMIATLGFRVTSHIAASLMVMNRGMHVEQALEFAERIRQAYTNAQKEPLLVQSLGLSPAQKTQIDKLLLGEHGELTKLAEVAEKMMDRPGFSTESLPGEFIVSFKKPGENGTFAKDFSYLSAETKHQANLLIRKLRNEGNLVDGPPVKKEDLRDFTSIDAPDQVLHKFMEVTQRSWESYVDDFAKAHGDDLAAELKQFDPSQDIRREMAVRGMNQYTVERKSKVDRSRYDYLDGQLQWVSRLAASMEFMRVRQMKDLILMDPRSKSFPSLKGMVNPHFENLMSPTSQLAKEIKTMATAYMMGGSLASTIMNATQSVTSLIPVLIQHGGTIGPAGAYKLLYNAIGKATSTTFGKDWQRIAREAESINPREWTLEQSQAAFLKKSITEGGINMGVIQDNWFSPTDQRTVMTQKFGSGDPAGVTKGELVRSSLYTGSQLALKPFGWVESVNNRIALLAGLEQGYKKGLRGDALYDHAKLVKVLSTYGGGKANAPGLVPKLSTPYTRSAVGVANTLQQYGYGTVALYAQQVKDMIGQSPALSPQERRQAMKAFGTMFATQVALGGALGLPFAAAGLTALEKVFGIPANQLVREGLASLGEDDQQGAAIAETALNGLGNQLFGLDVSSRLGVSNILGTSAYRGFNLNDMAGPVPSLIQNAVEGLNWFGKGEPMKAAHALVPNALRNVVEMADTKRKYGDTGMRDAGGDLLYNPTPSQAAAYLFGFRPRELSQKRQAQRLLTYANQRAQGHRSQELDAASGALLSGDPSAALTLANNARFADPTIDARSILRSVVGRAVDSVTEKDLLATGSTTNENERQRIAGTFGPGVVSRQSETQRAVLAAQLGARLGLTPDAKAFQKAAMVDALLRSSPNMPRSQALRLVEFLQ